VFDSWIFIDGNCFEDESGLGKDKGEDRFDEEISGNSFAQENV
jgi:hypothetical protein